MAELKPNHICKNPECRKHYYACNFCSRTLSWRSVACSPECYQKYVDLVIAERSKGNKVEIQPERTDMNKQEFQDLMNTPIETVEKETKEELKDFADEDGNVDFASVVDEVNCKLNKKENTRSKRKSSKE